MLPAAALGLPPNPAHRRTRHRRTHHRDLPHLPRPRDRPPRPHPQTNGAKNSSDTSTPTAPATAAPKPSTASSNSTDASPAASATSTTTASECSSSPADSTPNDEEPDFVGIERFRFMDTSGVLGSWQQCLSGRVWCSVWRNRAAIAKRMAERDAHCGGPRDRIMVDRFQWFARRGTPHVAGERGYQPAWQLM